MTRVDVSRTASKHTTMSPMFNHTIAQRIRHQQLMDEARKNENQDCYSADFGILETEEDEAVVSIDNWEDIMVEVTLDSGACRT